jgi:hypothetical protein
MQINNKKTIVMGAFAAALMVTAASAAPNHGRVAVRGGVHAGAAAHFNAGRPHINNSAARTNVAGSGARTNFSRSNTRAVQFSGNRSTNNWREHRRGNFARAFGAGLATGALIGGTTSAYGGYPYAYGDYGYADYGYDGYAYDDGYGYGAYAAAPADDSGYAAAPVANDEAYCEQRFRSYDPASGTYLGYDGLRHQCP